MDIQPSVYRNGIQTLYSSGVIPDDLLYFIPCGTNPHNVLKMQVTWLDEERRIKWMIDRRASIEWTCGPPKSIKRTCQLKGVITVQIEPRGEHLDRLIKIQRTRSKAFNKRILKRSSRPSISNPTATTYLKRSTMDRSIVTIDRNDRTVTPN